jgi:hypothetical protein
MKDPRRQQCRRVCRAGRPAIISAAAALLGLHLVAVSAVAPGALLLAVAVTLGLRARHWLSLAASRTEWGIGTASSRGVWR